MQYGRTLVAVMVTHVALDNIELATPGVGGHLACFHKEAAAASLAPVGDRLVLGRDNQTVDTTVDTMTEEQLLRGLEQLSPEDPTTDRSDRSRFPERSS